MTNKIKKLLSKDKNIKNENLDKIKMRYIYNLIEELGEITDIKCFDSKYREIEDDLYFSPKITQIFFKYKDVKLKLIRKHYTTFYIITDTKISSCDFIQFFFDENNITNEYINNFKKKFINLLDEHYKIYKENEEKNKKRNEIIEASKEILINQMNNIY